MNFTRIPELGEVLTHPSGKAYIVVRRSTGGTMSIDYGSDGVSSHPCDYDSVSLRQLRNGKAYGRLYSFGHDAETSPLAKALGLVA